MNINYKQVLYALMATAVGFISAGCSNDDDDDQTADNNNLSPIIEQYVNKTVIKTYTLLADEAMDLTSLCQALYQTPNQANVDAACAKWVAARKYWEESEAFLFGPASDYSIDPHIDSWPLDQTQLNNMLSNSAIMGSLDADYVGTYLGYGLLGFHALEYVLFRNGHSRNINEIPTSELLYAACVAEDLSRQCVRLEASWTGISNVTAEKRQILENCELEPTMNYGEIFLNAGGSGNTLYKTKKAAIAQILMGCSDIADEVGNTKIADPVASGNVLDVESWYSWNSIADFADNIRGIGYAYNGGRPENANSNSVSSYISKLNPVLDGKIKHAISNAITEIENMPAPFRNHLTEAETNAAKTACQNLQSLLDEAIDKIDNAN
jgi:predicted lipoprotein